MANIDDGKLDKILDHLQGIHDAQDKLNAGHAEMGKRLDSMEAGHKELGERLGKLEAGGAKTDDDETPEQKEKREMEEKADKERRDAMSPAEREREDKARRDATGREAMTGHRNDSADLSGPDSARFAEIQMRADAAYQAWGKQAPHALHGETLRQFQIRLLTPHKKHSKTYKDSALHLIGDDAVFSTVENAIINDSITASNSPETVGVGNLRKIVSRNDFGHTITKFVGDPAACWGAFMGGSARFGRIVRPAQR